MEEMEGYYGLLDGGSTAVIEMAACAGLPLVGENRHAEKTTTYGVGQLMAHAAGRGCKKMIVGLGGSATNDFGAGAAAALGVRFLDEAGEEFVPVGENLARVAKIDMSGLLPALRGIEVITMCDIDNPLCGKNGAAHIFGPQKGADPAMVEYLDGSSGRSPKRSSGSSAAAWRTCRARARRAAWGAAWSPSSAPGCRWASKRCSTPSASTGLCPTRTLC